MAEQFIIPEIGFTLKDNEIFVPTPRIDRRTKKGKEKFNAITERFGFNLGEWRVTPKKFKTEGKSAYGLMFKRKF